MEIKLEGLDLEFDIPESVDDRLNIPIKQSLKAEIDSRVDLIIAQLPKMTRAEIFRQVLDKGTKRALEYIIEKNMPAH